MGNNIVLTELGGMIILSILIVLALIRVIHYLKVGLYHLREMAGELRAKRKGYDRE